MTQIQALQTWHNGHHFRSRVEARWAVFFEHMGVSFDYEPEAYSDGQTAYLPDFLISLRLSAPDNRFEPKVFFEVKGAQPTPEELAKARMLAKLTNKHVLIAFGSFSSGFKSIPTPVMFSVKPDGAVDGLFHWSHCQGCDAFTFQRVTAFSDGCRCGYPHASSALAAAYNAARGARFGVHE